VAQALAELERVLPTLSGAERRRFARVEARLRAVLADRCGTAEGCRGCPGECGIDRGAALPLRGSTAA
jgi:hypothetical protein